MKQNRNRLIDIQNKQGLPERRAVGAEMSGIDGEDKEYKFQLQNKWISKVKCKVWNNLNGLVETVYVTDGN